VIPQVRAVAGRHPRLVRDRRDRVGFARQRTIGNFIAGLLIAFAQPLRIGDRGGSTDSGIVEEIGLTYTFIRYARQRSPRDPERRIASDTIRNSSIPRRRKLAR
jgi:small-conductance mechanosensitive channel